MRLAADMVQQVPQLARQDLVRTEIVRPVMQPDAAVAVDQDPVVRVRQILAGEPEIDSTMTVAAISTVYMSTYIL